MKIKDFKDNPVRYQEILDLCKLKGIQVDDETDVSEIIGRINSFNSITGTIARSGNAVRKRCNPGMSGGFNHDILDIIAAAGNERRRRR